MSVMVGGITAAELDDIDIPALSWTVPGLLPEGFGILAAAPKIGKSWLVLSLGLAVASGTLFLGVPVEQRPVLYLALEDGPRRLQERQRRILDGQPAPEALVLRTDPLDAQEAAKQFATDHAGVNPLIIIDTLARIRPERKRGADIYARTTSSAALSRRLPISALPSSVSTTLVRVKAKTSWSRHPALTG